jgi:Leucine-rich repeat (LRR) protein
MLAFQTIVSLENCRLNCVVVWGFKNLLSTEITLQGYCQPVEELFGDNKSSVWREPIHWKHHWCIWCPSKSCFVRLSDNQFIGEISPDWGECKNLTNLQMDGNRISGEIPAELEKLPQLRLLSLGSNALGNMSNNHLTGEVPRSLTTLAGLESLAYLITSWQETY